MPAVRRATIANELNEQIGNWLDSAHEYADSGDWTLKSYLKAAEKLAVADAYAASNLRAMIHHMAGDLDAAYHWIRNARNWPGDTESVEVEAIVLSNLGHFSRAAMVLQSQPPLLQRGEPFVSIALLTCSFNLVVNQVGGTSFADTEAGHEALALAEKGTMTMERINVSEAQVQAMLDVAGSVLRRHRLFFVGQKPVVRVIHNGVLYQLPIRANAEQSAAMTDEVIHEMVEKELDAPGLAFSFIPS